MVDTHKYTLKIRLVSLQFILHVYQGSDSQTCRPMSNLTFLTRKLLRVTSI